MEWLRRNFKTVVGALVILILLELVLVWYMLRQFRENYLSGDEAFAAALEDAGVGRDAAGEPDIDLKTKSGGAWYEVAFEADGARYVYRIDAETGAVLGVSG